jgi:hypothetical protein
MDEVIEQLSLIPNISCYDEGSNSAISLAGFGQQGRIDLTSLQCPGLGVGMEVDTASMIPLEEWQFESLA